MGKEINLGIFADNDKNIQQATLSLLSELGIKMEVMTQVSIPILDIMEGSLGKTPKTVQNICKKIDESYFVGVISDKTFKEGDKTASHEEACKNADEYDQMMVFAVDFKSDSKVTRSEIATLTRSLNRASKACPVVLVCRYIDEGGSRFAFSLCERTAYKQAGHTGEKAGKVNILRGINPNKPHTGHIRILEDMRLEKKDNTIKAVYNKWFGVFDNDVLTNKFYKELQDWFFWAVKHVKFPNDINDDTDDKIYNPQNVIRLITRLIFIWFLRQKGLVPKELFNREDLAHLVKDFEPDNFKSSTYYRVILQNLFFATLNKKIEERAFISDSFIENRNQGKHNIKTFMRHASDLAVSKEEFIKLVRPVPFMNNSLFECLDNKVQNGHTYNWDGFSDCNNPQRQAFVPNYLFFAEEASVDLSEEYGNPRKTPVKVFGLLTILKRYNFTVEENTPLDQDVALDPELLGKVFENLLAAYNPETEKTVRKSTGSYYTPRPIVQYMVDESLVAYLKESVYDVDEATLRSLLSYSDDDKISTLSEQQTRRIVEAILNCKVLDPACGSGAFPMGMLQQMNHLLSRVDATNKLWKEVVVNRTLNDEAFVDTMNDEEKETHKNEIEEVFRLSLDYPDYARKLYLIENCIYGVDIQSIAVQISRLRFFISLLCEQQPSDDASKNYNIKPLPNLEMKFVSANSLVRLENIDETRELFANKDILELIAKLKGVRHELFVVTDQHVKEPLLLEDDILRKQILSYTGKCYVKGIENKIKEYEQSVSRLKDELVIEKCKPDDIVQQSVQYNLFGEKNKIVSINRKEVKIKEITDNIRRLKCECDRLKNNLNSGRDKAMRLAKQLTDWNPYDQNISSPFFDPDWMFGVKGGFDIVIGNPPYIKEYTNRAAFNGFRETSLYYMGKMDLWYGFACHGIDYLKTNGVLCFIAQNNWTTSAGAKKMRNKVIKDCQILQMLDFNTYMVFENVGIQTMVMLFKKNHSINNYNIDYRTITQDNEREDMLALLNKQNRNTKYLSPLVDRGLFIDKMFTFSEVDNGQLFEKLANEKSYLRDDEVAQGIVPNPDIVNSRNKKNLSNQSIQVGEGVFVIDRNKFSECSEEERKYIKPLYEPYQMQRFYMSQKNEKCLLYITKANWKNDAPTLLTHLSRYKEIMQQRRENQNDRIDFMHLHWPRDEKFFKEGAKILSVRKCPDSPIFVYFEPQAYVMMAVNVILTSRWNMKFLTGVLNSQLVAFWLYHKGKMQGSNYQVDKEPLQGIPLPIVELDQQQTIITLVDQIITDKKQNPQADTSTLESNIDKIVYQLYGLTEEEIRIIEQSV